MHFLISKCINIRLFKPQISALFIKSTNNKKTGKLHQFKNKRKWTAILNHTNTEQLLNHPSNYKIKTRENLMANTVNHECKEQIV